MSRGKKVFGCDGVSSKFLATISPPILFLVSFSYRVMEIWGGGEEAVDVGVQSVWTVFFHAKMDDLLALTFHHAAADGVAVGEVGGVVELVSKFEEIIVRRLHVGK